MDIGLFETLCNQLRGFITPDSESFQKDIIYTEKTLTIVLYYIKDQGCLRMAANTFGVSVSTVAASARKVCDAICKLGPKYITCPKNIKCPP